MIGREIKKLLQTQKRVTIPSLGSFMRRGDGVILFTDMLKDNDGVLANALASATARTEQQALDEIARFVAQTEQSLTNDGQAELAEFGVLSRTTDGKVTFTACSTTAEMTPTIATSPAEPVAKVPQPTPVEPVAPTPQPPTNVNSERTEQPAQQSLADATKELQTRPAIPRVERRSVEKPRRQIDWVLLAAIAAAAIALAVMAYGMVGTDMTTIILE